MSRSQRNYIVYASVMALFGALIWWVIRCGRVYDTAVREAVPAATALSGESLREALSSNLNHPLPLLLLQIVAILVAVRIFSYLFKHLGQPGVIGEIVAGIVLGPSVLGHFFPDAFRFLFAPDSLVPLNVVSQIGLILFMFVIGMELDMGIVRRKASQTLVISHACIIVPFFMGMALAYRVYPEFGAGHTAFLPFALFVGISVSITAFPVLARIVQERGLGKTPMGMLAVASAANNDVTAWCLLAAVIAVAKAGNVAGALYTISLAALYILFMFLVVRPFLRKIGEAYNKRETVGKTLVAFIFLVLVVSSYITEVLGIHALFGAFLAGVIMPENLSFRRVMTERVEDVALVLFLPLFFVFTGLRTEIGLLDSPHLWGVCALFVVVSVAGKMLGAAGSARLAGESWKDSLSIGVLMNTRGLMELIVLNIGYEMGIIPASLFVIFVIMALLTTFMATPMLALIERLSGRRSAAASEEARRRPRVLISFADPRSGPLFLRLAHLLYGRAIGRCELTAVHYTIGSETNPLNAESYSRLSFRPLKSEARKLGLSVDMRYRVTDRYIDDLRTLAEGEGYDFVLTGAGPNFLRNYLGPSRRTPFSYAERRVGELLGWKNWLFPEGLTHDKTRILFRSMRCALGVFVNRGLSGIDEVGVVLCERGDLSLLRYIEAMAEHIRVQLLSVDPRLEIASVLGEGGRAARLSLCAPGTPLGECLAGKQLVVVSYSAWRYMTRYERATLRELPSFIIIRPQDASLRKDGRGGQATDKEKGGA